jgi:hypothetical protein
MIHGTAKFGIWIALFLIINAYLSHWYVSTVMERNIAIRSEVQFLESRQGLETLILGDSHSKWGADAGNLDAAFNLALAGQNYMQDYYLLRSLIERELIDPAFLVVGADLHQFIEREDAPWAFLHYYTRQFNYIEEGWRRGELLYYTMRQVQGRFAPYMGQRANILHFLETGAPFEGEHLVRVKMNRGTLVAMRGLEGKTSRERVDDATWKAAVHLEGYEPFHPQRVADFLRLLDYCEEQGILVLLVRFPLTAEYLEAAASHVDIEKHDRRVMELIANRPGVAVLDVRSRFADNARLFIDPDHLTSLGSKRLAPAIDRALVRLAARSRSRGSETATDRR